MAITNEFNELLYDEIIPRLFRQLYDLEESQQTEEHEVELIKLPLNGYYEVSAAKDKIVRRDDPQIKDEERAKSFHLDTYCFDSGSENWLFWDLLREQRVKKIYFTGMLTHGQSDFFIQYIDPDSRTVRSYYPDFIFQREEPDGARLQYAHDLAPAPVKLDDALITLGDPGFGGRDLALQVRTPIFNDRSMETFNLIKTPPHYVRQHYASFGVEAGVNLLPAWARLEHSWTLSGTEGKGEGGL